MRGAQQCAGSADVCITYRQPIIAFPIGKSSEWNLSLVPSLFITYGKESDETCTKFWFQTYMSYYDATTVNIDSMIMVIISLAHNSHKIICTYGASGSLGDTTLEMESECFDCLGTWFIAKEMVKHQQYKGKTDGLLSMKAFFKDVLITWHRSTIWLEMVDIAARNQKWTYIKFLPDSFSHAIKRLAFIRHIAN